MNQKLADQIRKGNIEITESGIFVPVLKAYLAGEWRVRKNDEPWEYQHNIVTTEGATKMLDVMFHNATQITEWYVGIYDAVITPAVGDTASVLVSKYAEATEYTSSTRPAWDEAAASGGSITDDTVTEFTANADSLSITGAFLVSNSVKESLTGTLFSAANFTTAKPLGTGDKLSVGYTLTAQDESV